MIISLLGADGRLGKCFVEVVNLYNDEGIYFYLIDSDCSLVDRADVLISFLGGNIDALKKHMELIQHLEKSNPRIKFILISSFGCGDSWDYLSKRAKVAFGYQVRVKSLSEDWLRTSLLDWIIIRPVGLSDDTLESPIITSLNSGVAGFVNRGDVAKFIFDCCMKKNLSRLTLNISEVKKD